MGSLRSVMVVGCGLGGWQARRIKVCGGVVCGCPSPLCAALGGFGFFRLVVYYLTVHVLGVVKCGFGQVYTYGFVRCDALV